MVKKQSAGILLYRYIEENLEVFLVHPGGPFWKHKNDGAWSIPKGEFTDDEQPLNAAIRELEEETGIILKGNFIELTPIKQKAGKIVYAWAVEGDTDAENIKCNMFQMEWPPKSGRMQSFPEVDKAEWFKIDEARQKINTNQFAFINELIENLKKEN